MLNEFKQFILKGDVVSLSTGVIIGAAFSKVVDGFSNGIVKPLLGAIGGNPDVSLRWWIFDLGLVVTSIIQFVITAAVIFFVIIKPFNHFANRFMKPAPLPPPGPSPEVVLLTEIRDSLRRPQ